VWRIAEGERGGAVSALLLHGVMMWGNGFVGDYLWTGGATETVTGTTGSTLENSEVFEK
jgi:hypothetical protein